MYGFLVVFHMTYYNISPQLQGIYNTYVIMIESNMRTYNVCRPMTMNYITLTNIRIQMYTKRYTLYFAWLNV